MKAERFCWQFGNFFPLWRDSVSSMFDQIIIIIIIIIIMIIMIIIIQLAQQLHPLVRVVCSVTYHLLHQLLISYKCFGSVQFSWRESNQFLMCDHDKTVREAACVRFGHNEQKGCVIFNHCLVTHMICIFYVDVGRKIKFRTGFECELPWLCAKSFRQWR